MTGDKTLNCCRVGCYLNEKKPDKVTVMCLKKLNRRYVSGKESYMSENQ